MIEQATVHLPHADRDTNPPVSIYLVHLSSEHSGILLVVIHRAHKNAGSCFTEFRSP
jgi:hypothetical protein